VASLVLCDFGPWRTLLGSLGVTPWWKGMQKEESTGFTNDLSSPAFGHIQASWSLVVQIVLMFFLRYLL